MKSGLFSLKLKDFLKGLVMAVGTPVLYLLQELIPNWPLNPLEKAALSATVTYLLKNLFTDDTKVAIKTIDAAGGEVIEKPKTNDNIGTAFKVPTLLIVAFLSLSIITTSCHVTWVPAASVEMKATVNTNAQKTDALYLKMISATDKNFSNFSDGYADIEAGINAIALHDSARSKAGNIYKSVLILQSHFDTYKNDHQARGKLTTGELTAYMYDMRAFWLPIQVQENSLK